MLGLSSITIGKLFVIRNLDLTIPNACSVLTLALDKAALNEIIVPVISCFTSLFENGFRTLFDNRYAESPRMYVC
jgi:hypothetical protein